MKKTTTQIDVLALPVADSAAAAKIKAAAGLHPSIQPLALAAAAVPKAPAPQKIAPGKERWPVKTGSDDDVAKVNQLVVPATLEELIRIPRPAGMKDPSKTAKAFQKRRAGTTEKTIWRVDCEMLALKMEDDGDYHLVLQGASGEMMVAEIPTPDPPFVKATSPFVDGIRASRKAIDQKFKKTVEAMKLFAMGKTMVPAAAFSVSPPSSHARLAAMAAAPSEMAAFKIKVKPTKVRLTGVGFFDRVHGQSGVAPNGIELHPVLNVRFT